MFKLVNLNIKYLLTKNNLIIILLVLFSSFVVALILSNCYISVGEQILYQEYYQNQYDYVLLSIYQIILIVLSCYIFSLIKNDSYFVLLKTNKFCFYLSKVISNCLIITLIGIILFFHYLIGGLITKWFSFDKSILYTFSKTLFQSFVFGLISNNLSYLFKTNFSFIFVFFLYIVCQNLLSDNLVSQVINIFVPASLESNKMFFCLLLSIILYFLTGFYLFKRYENY